MTGNDVLDFSRYFKGKNESPTFYKQIIDPRGKSFIPVDDLNLLPANLRKETILHYFVKDEKQNKATFSPNPPIDLYEEFYAVCSKDLSVDSKNNFACFNNSNILKARIDANRLQTEYDILVILTLIWGDETTYELAFGNVEKGSVVALSSQAIEYEDIFIKGFAKAVEKIQPEFICWYGNPDNYYDIINSAYDFNKIIPMQTRTQLIQQKILLESYKKQPALNFAFNSE